MSTTNGRTGGRSEARALRGGVGLLLLLQLFVSCGDEEADRGREQEYAIYRPYTRGPATFSIALTKKEITIADRLTMVLEASAEDGYLAELPRFGDKLQEFGIVDYTSTPPELRGDGTVVTRRTYELEPFLSGEYTIPPMAVTFWQEGDTLIHRLESDTITVQVSSILPEDQEELEIRDIMGPVEYPRGYRKAVIIAACVVAAGGAAFFFWHRRRRSAREAPAVPAHEIAYGRLEQLLAAGLVEEKRYREFTEEVSDILRHYIEDRFGLHAPERTTEEFLVEAGLGLPVNSEQKGIIREFLVHCDLVKFAALEPTAEDVKRTFETCRDFVDETREREEVKEQAA